MLIGRSAEKRRLKACLADPSTGLILVQGQSGAGKTALIETVLGEVRADGAIAGYGKYAEGASSSAFAPILQALSQTVSKALDLLYDPLAGTASLQAVLNEEQSLLAAAGFEALQAPSPTVSAQVTSESAVRIIDAIARVMGWLEGFGVPIILFVDDWHRASAEAQRFAALVSRVGGQRLCTVILAERISNRTANAIRHKAETITLGPLSIEDRTTLLDAASGDTGAGSAIAEWLGTGGSGLPLDLLDAAQALQEREALAIQNGRWAIDTTRAAAIDRADFSDSIVRRARALPAGVLELGVALALWGDEAELQTMSEALDQPFAHIADAASALGTAGFVKVADGTTTFLHDRLRAALLNAVEPDVRATLAAMMAEQLREKTNNRLPDLTRTILQLRLSGGLQDVRPSIWRDRFALGAQAARTVADSSAANDFAEAAWALQLRETSPDIGTSRLIVREALFAAATRHDLATIEERARILVSLAKSRTQLAEAYEAAIMVLRLADDYEQAWRWSVEAMGRMGLKLPAVAKLHHVIGAAVNWHIGFALRRLWRPLRQDDELDPLSRLSNIAALVAFERQPLQAILIALRAATRARRLGLQDSIWVATDAFICATLKDYDRAAALGTMAAARPSKFLKSGTLYRATHFGVVWRQPFATLRAACRSTYSIAMSEGDLASAALAVRADALVAWRSEPTLADFLRSLAEDEEKAERLGDGRALEAIRHSMNFARALQSPLGLPALSDKALRGNVATAPAEWAKNMPVVRIEILAVREDWAALADLCENLKSLRNTMSSHPGGVIWRFYDNVARLRIGLNMRRGDLQYLRRVAALNPTDHRGKVVLLEAELLRLGGKRDASLRKYALAVEIAAGLASRFEAGVIMECAASGARILGDEDAAVRHQAAAQSVWRGWGATAKIIPSDEKRVPQDHGLEVRLAEAESQVVAAVRADRAKSRFLAEVGHELRTPLQAMQGLFDLAASDDASVDVGELRDVFSSLKSVVDDLTDLGALGADAPLRLSATDLSKLVESEAALFGTIARRKGLTFTTEAEWDPGVWLRIDGARVRQIVRNLLSNAVKYVDRGTITLRLSAQKIGENAFSILIAVEDTGPGLREADLAKLFEPFERSGRDDDEGLGLGMALSRRIAQRMGGTLVAENRPQGGARFVFSFTAERAAGALPQMSTAPARILLVEDVALNRRLLATLLRSNGHEVVEAAEGGIALGALAESPFDLVILDLGLPDMNGFDVLARMRAKTLVIVLTASAAEAIDARALQAGAKLVLHKPVSAAELREAIANVMPHTSFTPEQAPPALAQDLYDLSQEAHREIRSRAIELVRLAAEANSPQIAKLAHRLAGLAAQFGETQLAEAADALEKAGANDRAQAQAVREMEIALDALAPVAP
ncbi:MAG TPA: ATP-binding protein [Rhizomicrobium sp.]|jgi:signal transduction histidine kinase/CheY-like chemotaxis protein